MKLETPWLALGGFLAACFAVAAIGGVVTAPAVRDWYPTLARPSWTPPSWLFGPVWALLYAMMAVAAWLVWRRAGWCAALGWFAAQLALNSAWSPLFFGLRQIGWALADIALLWGALLGTTIVFWKASPLAGALLVPYLAWVTFATALNAALWRLNS